MRRHLLGSPVAKNLENVAFAVNSRRRPAAELELARARRRSVPTPDQYARLTRPLEPNSSLKRVRIVAFVVADPTILFVKNHPLHGFVSLVTCLVLNLNGQAPRGIG
jgi:hypothetical protein